MSRTIPLILKLSLLILIFLVFCLFYSGEIRAIAICYCHCSVTLDNVPVCQWMECEWSCAEMPNCPYEYCEYCFSCGGCFPGETEVEGKKVQDSKIQRLQIQDLDEGDIVSSFNPESGEISEGKVSDIKKTGREGYYILETESGKKVKVTAEHPFLAVSEKNLTAKIKEVLSHTLTFQLITSLHNKLNGAFD